MSCYPPLRERFWSKVNKTPGQGPTGTCWTWKAGRMHHKDPRFCYGQFWMDGTNKMAHRVSWMLSGRILFSDLQIMHKCDNPPCVNPDHLFPGTALDNNRDSERKKRRPHRKGSQIAWAKLDEAKVRDIKERLNKGETQNALAKDYEVCRQAIGQIVRGLAWKHVK